MTESLTTSPSVRLDDLFRCVVHLRAESVFEMIAPDIVQGDLHAVTITRLDSQLAPPRLLPDAAYLIEANSRLAVVAIEGQRRSATKAPERATTIAMALAAAAPVGNRQFALRLIELRTGARHCPGRNRPRPPGEVDFEPSNLLLDLDPADERFADPTTWTLLAFSRNVSAADLDALQVRLADLLHDEAAPKCNCSPMDAYLLGAISRVRFPEYPWSHTAQESYVNDTQGKQRNPYGYLTPEEVQRIELQAAQERRRVLAEMEAAAEARGWNRGIEKAERSLLLELAHKLAPERAAELGALDSIADLKREVMALVER